VGLGKTPFLAALSAVELCGPCRFAGWDGDGNPITKQHKAPWIQIAGVNQDQSRNSMTVFPGLFSKKAVEEYHVDLGKLIIYAHRGAGRIEAVTSSPRALEGGRPSWVVLDETQHWIPSGEGPNMMAAIQRNLAKSRDGSARLMEITNAHLVGEMSVAETTYEAWRQSDGQHTDIYYDSTEAPLRRDPEGAIIPVQEWTDSQIRDALFAARGDSIWLDVDRLLAEIRDPATSESLTRRFYFNQVWEGVNEEWLPVGAWAARATGDRIPPGSEVILAVDGSYNDDSTGIVAATCSSQPHLDVIGCWEPDPTSDETRTVPIEEVEDTIRQACRKWRVREINFDPYRWARTMQALAKEGLRIVEFPNSPERMITASQRFQTAVVNGTLTHSADTRLARHVGNCVVRENSRGKRIVKETKWSPRKIDLAVAAVMAHDRAASRPGIGAGWISYFANDLERQGGGKEGRAEDAVASPPAATPATPTPSLTLARMDGSVAPEARPSISCKHRWWADGLCVYCGSAREG